MTESDNEEENAESLHKFCVVVELLKYASSLLTTCYCSSKPQNSLSSFPRSLLDDSVSDKISLAGPRPLYAQNRIRTFAWRNFWR
jgi:hypothetical protein